MPGISFLFKKRFHPSRLDQQKRVFIAEEKTKQHAESERELALQVAKERELQGYEGLGKAPEQDPRHASLKFMYNAPATAKGKEKIDLLAKAAPVQLDENGDDEHVRAFRAKFTSNSKSNDQSSSSNDAVVEYLVPLPPGSKGFEGDGADDLEDPPAVDAPTPHYHQTALEQAIGRKKQAIVTIDEQVTRHPRLKNAPVEGNLQGNKDALAVRHKPFNDVIRNVRCLRCGNWGHRSGDRECPLRDHNPLDFERQQREDPMARHNRNASSSSNSYESQPYANYHQDRDNRGNRDSKYGPRGSMSSSSDCRQRHDKAEDEIDSGYLSSDPETAFLQTLTRREKRLLLRKLQSLEGHKDTVSDLKTTDVTRSEEKRSKTIPMDNKDKKPEKWSKESRSSSNDDKRRSAKRSRADREDEEGHDRIHKSNKKRRKGSHHKKRRYSSGSSESSSSSSSDSSDDDSSSSSSSSSSASSR